MHSDDYHFQENIKVIILRKFAHQARANIVAARLREAGIPCFISNATASGVLPFMEDGYVLHVNADDVQDAKEILHSLENDWNTPDTEDFRDADQGDIAFEKAIFESERRMQRKEGRGLAIILIIIALILIGLQAYFGKTRDRGTILGVHGRTGFDLYGLTHTTG